MCAGWLHLTGRLDAENIPGLTERGSAALPWDEERRTTRASETVRALLTPRPLPAPSRPSFPPCSVFILILILPLLVALGSLGPGPPLGILTKKITRRQSALKDPAGMPNAYHNLCRPTYAKSSFKIVFSRSRVQVEDVRGITYLLVNYTIGLSYGAIQPST